MSSIVGPPRGILTRPRGAGRFHHARLPPAPGLTRIVQHYWIVRWELDDGQQEVAETLPHPNVHLVLEAGQSRVVGIQTGRFTRRLSGRGGVFGIKLRPGAFRPWLGRSVSTLRNRSLPLATVFDRTPALEADVLGRQNDALAAAAADRYLASRLPPADANAIRAADMVDAIAEDRTVTDVAQLSARWQVGKRSLQRLFNEYVGVGPKWVICRYRLHEALERAGEAPGDWTGLAHELGYFDQAHFIRDFKALVGCSPARWARARGSGPS